MYWISTEDGFESVPRTGAARYEKIQLETRQMCDPKIQPWIFMSPGGWIGLVIVLLYYGLPLSCLVRVMVLAFGSGWDQDGMGGGLLVPGSGSDRSWERATG